MYSGTKEISAQDLKVISSRALEALGTIGRTLDGRVFRYARAGASDLAAGQLAVAEAKVANHTNIAVQADAAIGATSVSVTLGATAATQDQYADGILSVVDGTGKGVDYLIKGHPAAALSTTLVVYLAEPLAVAVTSASSKVSLQKNVNADLVASTTASLVAGVPKVVITATYYGWVQTHGRCSVLSDGTIAKSAAIKQSTSVAGAVAATSAATDQAVGVVPEATVDTKYYPVKLSID